MAKKITGDISQMLPTDAYNKGWRLTCITLPEITDPVYLTETRAPGRELYWWDYIPSLTEVFEVCKKLEANHG